MTNLVVGRSLRKRFACMMDGDLVIGEIGVHFVDLVFGHMTAYTFFLSDRTSGTGMIVRRLCGGRESVTTQAVLIVRTWIGHERSVRIMACHASHAWIAIFSPAATGLEPIGRKTNTENSGCAKLHNIEACPVTGTAKVYRILRRERRRIRN